MATRPGVTTVGNRTVPALAPGDRVTHDKFGLGTVVSADGYGDQAEAKIDFGASTASSTWYSATPRLRSSSACSPRQAAR